MTRNPRLTREELLAFMETNWGRTTSTINALTDEEQLVYARAHGFNGVRELLAHLCAQLANVLNSITGRIDSFSYVPDPTSPAVRGDFVNQTLEQLEEDFEQLWTGVAGVIGDLPNGAFDDPEVYNWLYTTVVEQYLAFEPPGDPQTPAEQHSQVRPEPGYHSASDESPPLGTVNNPRDFKTR
jgi:hypothetical protein